ncbi:MAG: ATP-binding protein, partial [Alphaproteobacteria bacterium PA3]
MKSTMSEVIAVSNKFTRSVRIDVDYDDPLILKDYVFSATAMDTLSSMATQRKAFGHGAFTWTGPYGSGKSSLAVALNALLMLDIDQIPSVLPKMDGAIGPQIVHAFRDPSETWRVIKVIGSRADLSDMLLHALETVCPIDGTIAKTPMLHLKSWLGSETNQNVALMIDELGKCLEHAALSDGDIQVLQELAEFANRSEGRFIIIGILHQSLDEYAVRLGTKVRDEWVKIQGRFSDIPFNLSIEEQVHLISKAIQKKSPLVPHPLAGKVAAAFRPGDKVGRERLQKSLVETWPLHPISAGLLAAASRRRFAQNQRSIFSFLNSTEPFGFQEFLG